MYKHFPARGDAVEAWLKSHRDLYDSKDDQERWVYYALDAMLDEYRARADFGIDLHSDDMPDGAFG